MSTQRKKIRLGELLIKHKVISEEQLNQALAEQRRSGRKLGRVLTDIGAISENELHRFLAEHLRIPFVDLKHVSFNADLVRLLPEVHARRYRALVLQEDKQGLLVGMADPTDIFALDELSRILQRPVRQALVTEADLLRSIDVVYRRTEEIASLAEELSEELAQTEVDIDELGAGEAAVDAPVIKLIQSMFQDAVQVHASDIHIEPGERNLRVRQRVDGVLQEHIIEGRRVANALVTRLKLMCNLDISEKRLPQDGRFTIRVGDQSVDVRVSTMPVQHGEAVVLRLLDQSAALMRLESLGMPEALLPRFRRLLGHTAGMILVTGPTGSGKTTTLYAGLNEINSPTTKIITAEDPVEYRIERINQVQVNPKIGLTFARVLRTALRQDPDVILVGEMRDQETVEIGLRAAMTGHLVFSTLHTINATATVNRLVDMGAPGYLIASALHAVVSQRLVRRVCEGCKQPAELTAGQQAWLHTQAPELNLNQAAFVEGSGCTYCNLTGYRGRIGVYELLEIDTAMADAIRREDAEDFVQAARRSPGFRPLARAALDAALAGITTPEEVIRVASGIEEYTEPLVPLPEASASAERA